jgi:hypothetical protein
MITFFGKPSQGTVFPLNLRLFFIEPVSKSGILKPPYNKLPGYPNGYNSIVPGGRINA